MSDPTKTVAESRKEEEEAMDTEEMHENASKADVLSFAYDGAKCNISFNSGGVNLDIKNNTTPPHKKLVDLMELLAEDLASEGEVESTLESNPVVFTKFTVSEKKGRYGYKLVGKRVLAGSRSPMSIVSAPKWNEHADTKQALDPTTTERLEALQGEIRIHLANLMRPVVEQTLFGEVVKPPRVIASGTVVPADGEDEDPDFEIVEEDDTSEDEEPVIGGEATKKPSGRLF